MISHHSHWEELIAYVSLPAVSSVTRHIQHICRLRLESDWDTVRRAAHEAFSVECSTHIIICCVYKHKVHVSYIFITAST